MALARTFVGFSSSDINYYRMMLAWKNSEHIDFNFCDCQLQDEIDSENEEYIKRMCRARIDMAGTYLMLIGQSTRRKHKYVLWEAEVALEKGCRIIGVNLDRSRVMNPCTCPGVLQDVGAVFVSFSPQIIAHAIETFEPPNPPDAPWYYYPDSTYRDLGYLLLGPQTFRLPKTPPFAR
jgi:hypothetical protein